MSEVSTRAVVEYENKKLTRQSMMSVLALGGSIVVGGKVINNASELPDSVDFAQTPQELAKVEAEVAEAEAQLAAKREKLNAAKKSIGVVEEAPVEEAPVEEEPTFGENNLPLSHFKGKDVDEILAMEEPGIGRRKAERIVAKLEELND